MVTIRLVLIVQICLGLILGIMLTDLLGMLITLVIGMVIFALGRRRLIWLSVFMLFGLGWYLLWFSPGRVEQIEGFVGQTIVLLGTVVQDPVPGEIWQRLVFASEQLPQLVQLEVPNHPSLSIGDRIRIEAKLAGVGELDAGYANYLRGQGIFYIARSRNIDVIGIDTSPWYAVGRLKNSFVAKVATLFDPPGDQVLLGLLVGGQGEFSAELKQQFIVTGITHIFSVSGYNVGIVTFAFLSLAGIVDRRLLVKLAMAGLLLFGIAVAPGNAAAVRAVMMGEFVLLSLLLGKSKYLPLMLMYAVTLMLLIYPMSWRNVSMQLSVAAMLGILFVLPVWERVFAFLPGLVRETLVVTLAVTVATLPISLANFGGLSLVSLPANLMVLPMLPIIMIAGGLGILSSVMLPSIAHFWSWLCSGLIGGVLKVIELLAAIPGAYSEDMGTNWLAFGLVVVVFIFLDYRLTINRYKLSRQKES